MLLGSKMPRRQIIHTPKLQPVDFTQGRSGGWRSDEGGTMLEGQSYDAEVGPETLWQNESTRRELAVRRRRLPTPTPQSGTLEPHDARRKFANK
jgi:hypothetical protein